MSTTTPVEPLPDQSSPERVTELRENLEEVRLRVKAASAHSSFSPTLVAVSKLKPASDIFACFEAGQLDFGENYAQELVDKAKVLPDEIRWHFIGSLQSNKAKLLASIPNLYSVQTLSSSKAATALNKALPTTRLSPLNVFIQVNTSGEDSKSGLPPLTQSSTIESSELVQLAVNIITEYPHLHLEGLMTIGALEQSLNTSDTAKNADFETLKETRDVLHKHLSERFGVSGSNVDLGTMNWGVDGTRRLRLSMGMSSDFESALKSGADVVRVGTSIFGQRAKRIDM